LSPLFETLARTCSEIICLSKALLGNRFFRFACEADEDARAGNRGCRKNVSDRELLPGPSLSNQCAANVPQDLQTREFFEAFEGTWEPSVRAFVVGKEIDSHRWTALSLVPRDLPVTQEAAGQVNLVTLE
jgi:hypothetical protein